MPTSTSLLVVALVAVAGALGPLAHLAVRRLLRARAVGPFSFYPPPVAYEASRSARLATRASGPLTVYLAAVLLCFVGLRVIGATAPTTRVRVLDGPGRAAGIRDGDRILAVAGAPVASFPDVRRLVSASPGRSVAVRLERAAQELTLSVTPDRAGRIMVQSLVERAELPVGTAIAASALRPLAVYGALWRSFAAAAGGGLRAAIAGPVGILRAVGATETGAAIVYAGDLVAWLWLPYLLVVLAATLVSETAGRRAAARPSAPRA